MYQPDEKNIDRLSREAAEHYHAPGKPGWDALQQILDKELPQEEEKKRRGFFFFFFLLLGVSLAGSGLLYGIHVISNKPPVTITETVSKNKNIAEKSAAGQSSAPGTSSTLSDENNSTESSRKKQPVLTTGKNDAAKIDAGAAVAQTTSGSLLPAGNSGTSGSNKNIPVATANKNSATVTIAQKLVNSSYKNKTSPGTASTTINNHVSRTPVTTAGTAPLGNRRVRPAIAHEKINPAATGSKQLIVASRKNPFVKRNNLRSTNGNENTYGDNADGIARIKHTRSGKKTTAMQIIQPASDDAADAASNNASTDTATGTAQNDAASRLPVIGLQDSNAITSNKKTAAPISLPMADTAVIEKKDSAKTAIKKTSSKNNRSITIGIVAGIDLSTVKFTHSDNAGYNFGLMAGYQFNRRWSVYTGVIYTKKNYALEGSDYHPPKHYWTQYVNLQTVEGYCRMWELPLLARYNFNPGAKTVFFASTGLSSYFMKKQQYNYSYKNNMNQQLSAEWSNDSTFNHVFSILHLSAGFEKPLGRHMNWQIEPYAKIPLGGVGFGNIRLSSFGVNFSVQYRQRIRR